MVERITYGVINCMAPIFGVWSDRTVSRYGKRSPWIWGSMVMAMVMFAVMWYNTSRGTGRKSRSTLQTPECVFQSKPRCAGAGPRRDVVGQHHTWVYYFGTHIIHTSIQSFQSCSRRMATRTDTVFDMSKNLRSV